MGNRKAHGKSSTFKDIFNGFNPNIRIGSVHGGQVKWDDWMMEARKATECGVVAFLPFG